MASEHKVLKEEKENIQKNVHRMHYSEKNYILKTCPWPEEKNHPLSEFDRLIRSSWETAIEKGYFRYTLEDMETRVLPGEQSYVVQLNTKRKTDRRKPEFVDHLNMPFDHQKFNFTKVKADETICEFCPMGDQVYSNYENDASHRYTPKSETAKNLILINVSPLEYGHILLVPDVESCINQRLTFDAIRLSLEMILLSSHRGFRVGFNSLCAMASVNHQHVHGWYLDYPLRIEDAPVQHVHANVYEMIDRPTRAFAFQLHDTTIDDLIQTVWSVVAYFQDLEIAHNMFLTRGSCFGEHSEKTTVRIYLWPRKKVMGIKNESQVIFHVAVAELAGHIPIYDPNVFDRLTEEDITRRIQKFLLSDEEFNIIRDDLKCLCS